MIFQLHVDTIGHAEVFILPGVLYAVYQIAGQSLRYQFIVEGYIQCNGYGTVSGCLPAGQIFRFEHHILRCDGVGIFTDSNVCFPFFFEATDIRIGPAFDDGSHRLHVLAALGAQGFEVGLP